MIANCSHDERGKLRGGKAGDQTGKEYVVRSWYNRPWSGVLRYPDKEVGKEIAKLAHAAAENNAIGYDQYARLTFDKELQKTDDPAKITKPCESDCTASTAAIIRCAGRRLKIQKLAAVSPAMYSGNAKAILTAAGFKWLDASKYRRSDKYLQPGDILLYIGHHAAINLDTGKAVKKAADGPKSRTKKYTGKLPLLTVKKGSTGTQVKLWQAFLNWALGSALVEDGIFGARTDAATKSFQEAAGTVADGIVGPKTRAKAKAYRKF